MQQRILGRSGIKSSPMGLGCWAVGGPAWAWRGGTKIKPIGWGDVDDSESVRAIHAGFDMGITLLDTAHIYGCGHSEEVVGEAIKGKRDKVIIATKFGLPFDEKTKTASGKSGDPDFIRQQLEDGLRRLQIDCIDLYQYHPGDGDDGEQVRDLCEDLVREGKIRYFGWSTDDPKRVEVFVSAPHCTITQQRLNIFEGNREVLALCEEHNLADLIRTPLGMGILTGKFSTSSKVPDNDVRSSWDFQHGDIADRIKKMDAIRDILTSEGRTLAQGALCWLWGLSDKTIPIPGFKTVEQVKENAGAMRFSPLSKSQMEEIEKLVGRK